MVQYWCKGFWKTASSLQPCHCPGYCGSICVLHVSWYVQRFEGLGGNGLPAEYTSTAANCNVALYATFSVFGFFGGSFVNRLGAKWVIAFGGIGYALYSGAYLCFDHTQNKGFVIAAGAILGVCAGLLWAGQGVIVLSYATEDLKVLM